MAFFRKLPFICKWRRSLCSSSVPYVPGRLRDEMVAAIQKCGNRQFTPVLYDLENVTLKNGDAFFGVMGFRALSPGIPLVMVAANRGGVQKVFDTLQHKLGVYCLDVPRGRNVADKEIQACMEWLSKHKAFIPNCGQVTLVGGDSGYGRHLLECIRKGFTTKVVWNRNRSGLLEDVLRTGNQQAGVDLSAIVAGERKKPHVLVQHQAWLNERFKLVFGS